MTVILLDPRRPTLVPVEALELLAGDVQYTEELPVKVPWSLPSARAVHTGENAPVLVSSDPAHPAVAARIAAGERVIAAPEPAAGERLLDAVAVMDRLRTNGPWESEQTHESLRRYLLEETYELFDAVHRGDAEELRDELGDVLLQVLFHARIAEEATQHAFTIDDVADALVRKLAHRVPTVLGGQEVSLADQLAQWEERKSVERAAKAAKAGAAGLSVMDDLPTGQPALALAQKVISRARQAGIPADLIPSDMLAIALAEQEDAENTLRSEVLSFMDDVRAVESEVAVRRTGAALEGEAGAPHPISPEEWRAAWPSDTPQRVAPEELHPVPGHEGLDETGTAEETGTADG